MTTINVNTIAPSGSTLTVGDSGDTIVVLDEIKVNTVKDAGGNTLWVSNGSGTLSSVSGFGGALNLLSTQTASSSASLSFTSGIDSTYKEYVFKFIHMHPATADARMCFKASTDGGSSYGVSTTTTAIQAYHRESDSASGLSYVGGDDASLSTGLIRLSGGMKADADQGYVASFHLFNPASTTYVKNFYVRSGYQSNDTPPASTDMYFGGYVNTTSAVDAIQFSMDSGNIDAGKIKMYGVS